jgi:ankyrin repeat protein
MSCAVSQVRPEQNNARYEAVIRALNHAHVESDVFAAIACNDIRLVEKILQADPKIGEAKNPTGRPALHQAVTLDRKEIVKLLLAKGTNPDIRAREFGVGYDNETALLQAAFWGRTEIAEMLIKHGATVNAKAENDVTPLHEAARMGHLELARLLLKSGADVNAKDTRGETPLAWASKYKKDSELIKLLRDYGGTK